MSDPTDITLARLYYSIKPLLPRSLRWGLRRKIAAGIRRRNLDIWPVDESAGATPQGWAGWPKGKRFTFVLTHDVEGPEGLGKVRKLAEMEQAAGFRSSFNFIPEGDYCVPDELREWLTGRGFEIGVHDLHHDGKLYQSRERFQAKAEIINRYLKKWGACGFRSGFMFRQLDWLHELDTEYDASTFDTDPFEPQPEGCRTIFPFMVTPESKERGSGYVELSYTLPQDSTLFLLLSEKSPEIWMKKLDWIASKGGMALVNIHPDYMAFPGEDSSDFLYPSSHLQTFLDYLNERYEGEFWNPLARELAVWFRGQDCANNSPVESGEDRRSEVGR